jgi:hypothetical protein
MEVNLLLASCQIVGSSARIPFFEEIAEEAQRIGSDLSRVRIKYSLVLQGVCTHPVIQLQISVLRTIPWYCGESRHPKSDHTIDTRSPLHVGMFILPG